VFGVLGGGLEGVVWCVFVSGGGIGVLFFGAGVDWGGFGGGGVEGWWVLGGGGLFWEGGFFC